MNDTAKKPAGKKRKFVTPKTAPYFFIAPAVLLFIVFTIYPVVSSLILSFQTSTAGVTSFAGLDNYRRLFADDLFYQALFNTFTILIVQVPIMLTIAVVLAVLMNSALLKMRSFFRIAFFMPAITALVAYAIVFMIMLDENYGFVNYALSWIGIEPIAWLNHPFWAKVSLIIAITWRWTGYNMVILLAGLQNISQDLYEAASIDGAGKVRQFFSITLPQLKPILLFTAVLSTIGTLQLFDEPFILTNGGPNNSTLTISLYLYLNGFRYFDFNYASAIAYVLVVIIALLSFIQMKVLGDDDDK
ncbi:carbohydrate ABC transporter permease [Alkalicoccus daliensis]|uniref:Carbohydrate ABC transporter membrane protein 1, CUT1 family (TC 3.A.1.1.-) n=1 Tax=Alkalicoccus daliensis TaxID=745820 RepID=A0A1H0L6Z5_9BACI|nr:sugar ABC transporter permease [Alkalicoccus daliensis]SDO63806.1 carbohydrate ABC transporter membrane protein 1, CUT1 family (TC 3.A.1.1.-) [Alkalicoccus daliensis]